MKKQLCILVASLSLIVAAAVPVYADNTLNFSVGTDNRGPEELNSAMDDILLNARSFLKTPVDVEDIDLSRAEKIYIIDNEDDLPLTALSKGQVLDYLERCDYFWQLPVTAGGKTIEIQIDRDESMPDTTGLSESTIAYINEYLGKWHVVGGKVPNGKDHVDLYKERAEDMASRQRGLAGQDWDAVMVYGMYGTMGYATLLMSEDSVEYLMPLVPPMGLEVPAEVLAETSFMDYDGMLLPFSDLQEMIDNRPKPEAGGLFSVGGGGDWGLSAEAGCRDKEELLGF